MKIEKKKKDENDKRKKKPKKKITEGLHVSFIHNLTTHKKNSKYFYSIFITIEKN